MFVLSPNSSYQILIAVWFSSASYPFPAPWSFRLPPTFGPASPQLMTCRLPLVLSPSSSRLPFTPNPAPLILACLLPLVLSPPSQKKNPPDYYPVSASIQVFACSNPWFHPHLVQACLLSLPPSSWYPIPPVLACFLPLVPPSPGPLSSLDIRRPAIHYSCVKNLEKCFQFWKV